MGRTSTVGKALRQICVICAGRWSWMARSGTRWCGTRQRSTPVMQVRREAPGGRVFVRASGGTGRAVQTPTVHVRRTVGREDHPGVAAASQGNQRGRPGQGNRADSRRDPARRDVAKRRAPASARTVRPGAGQRLEQRPGAGPAGQGRALGARSRDVHHPQRGLAASKWLILLVVRCRGRRGRGVDTTFRCRRGPSGLDGYAQPTKARSRTGVPPVACSAGHGVAGRRRALHRPAAAA